MTDDQWDAISMLLDKGFKWREPFGEAQAQTYRILLDGHEPDAIGDALRGLVAGGQVFGPTPGEIVALIRRDPSMPTFEEALALVRSALKAGRRPLQGDFSTEAQMIGAREDAVRAAARELHPLVASFVVRCSDLSRLEDEVSELAGGEYAGARRHELEQRWQLHVEAMEGRDVAALTAPRSGNGLARLDPLTALGAGFPYAPKQLRSGGGA